MENNIAYFATQAPGQVAPQTNSGAVSTRVVKSGNSKFDPGSGQFTTDNKSPAQDAPVNPVPVNAQGLPQGVTVDEWDRRRDTVRDAARSIQNFTPEDLQSFLSGRVNNLAQIDIQAFVNDVRQQRLDDLVDVLGQRLQRGRNIVSVRTTRGWHNTVIAGLTDDELVSAINRLKSRGFKDKDIVNKVVNKINDSERKARIKSTLS